MFRKLLIANRGEIACRVISSAGKLGIRTVAVYSDADCGARHVAIADEARRIGPAEASASYLNGEAILAAAQASGAEAIHPGYGFLSENAEFAAACAAAGLVFVGPSPEAIAAMGDKAAAKRCVAQAGVPLLPGYHGENQDPAFLREQAEAIGYPLLIKACAGGGGKGMRIVHRQREFAAALAAAQREAKAAFGDPRVLIERYLARARHIEVQVFGDTHGNLVHLFERDCSLQRRHQKVLEEAPAPGLSAGRRKAMGEAAIAAARSVRYSSAGTVEFIAAEDIDRGGPFYFMEMNTRLQVEHPVTELITGLDLVRWQLAVAAGEPLPLRQDEIELRGHAIEARIYAENPASGFLPSTGKLRHLRLPAGVEFSAGALRVDSGVREGDTITPHYDPLLAKLVVWGEDRDIATARLGAALAGCEIVGVANNVEFLSRTVSSEAYRGADLDTGLIERCRAELLPAETAPSDEELAAAALAELLAEQAAQAQQNTAEPNSPWSIVDGWRLNLGSHHEIEFSHLGETYPVQIHFSPEGYRLGVGGREYALAGQAIDGVLHIRLGEASFRIRAVRDGSDWHLFRDGRQRVLRLQSAQDAPAPDAIIGSLAAPMPGKVLQILVQPGAQVKKGAALLILEAMKMEHNISAPYEGRVVAIHYQAGEQVDEGAELLRLDRD